MSLSSLSSLSSLVSSVYAAVSPYTGKAVEWLSAWRKEARGAGEDVSKKHAQELEAEKQKTAESEQALLLYRELTAGLREQNVVLKGRVEALERENASLRLAP